MGNDKASPIKTAFEIGSLAGQLTPQNQSYVLNTINALLFSQQSTSSVASKKMAVG
ncbi:hypothetical protein [Paenibacillus antibioticophila]|uniref:hypothetical protein n=1 Tax=Paenibacillus antibioticophila TaxID=1274374 RepID=UPI000A5B3188|nr:hypothetical protein [Paenibacillus antibioticophila]